LPESLHLEWTSLILGKYHFEKSMQVTNQEEDSAERETHQLANKVAIRQEILIFAFLLFLQAVIMKRKIQQEIP
jgi:hypothetical protein